MCFQPIWPLGARLRVSSNVDVGLMICCLLSIDDSRRKGRWFLKSFVCGNGGRWYGAPNASKRFLRPNISNDKEMSWYQELTCWFCYARWAGTQHVLSAIIIIIIVRVVAVIPLLECLEAIEEVKPEPLQVLCVLLINMYFSCVKATPKTSPYFW